MHEHDAEPELERLRAQGDTDRRRIDELIEQGRHDAHAIERLQRQADSDQAEIAGLRDDVAAGERARRSLLDRLRDEAEVHDAALLAVRDQLASAELELDDLRAVRDALTPPALPERPGLRLSASFVPAMRRVSGDFYLAVAGPQDATVIVVGDVAGKGIEAARQAAFVRTAFVSTAAFTSDPCRLLDWANTALLERERRRFVTAVCVTFEPAARRLRWALAGHPPPLRLGSGEELTGGKGGTPLGVFDSVGCHADALELPPGAGVLLYTDGLVESRDQAGQLFGVERAAAVLRALTDDDPEALLARLREEAASFGGGALGDDLCLLTVTAT